MELDNAKRDATQGQEIEHNAVQQRLTNQTPLPKPNKNAACTPFGKMDDDGKLWPVLPRAQITPEEIAAIISSSTDGNINTEETRLTAEIILDKTSTASQNSLDDQGVSNFGGKEKQRRSHSGPSDGGEALSSQSSNYASSISSIGRKSNDYENFRTKRRDVRRNSYSNPRRRNGDSRTSGRYGNNRDVMDPWAPRGGSAPRTPPPFNSFPTPQIYNSSFREWHGSTPGSFPLLDTPEWYSNQAPRRGHPPMYRQRERRNGVADYDFYSRADDSGYDTNNSTYPRQQKPSHSSSFIGHENNQRNSIGGSGWENTHQLSGQSDSQKRGRYQNRSRYDRFQKTNSQRPPNSEERRQNVHNATNYPPKPSYNGGMDRAVNALNQGVQNLYPFDPRRPQSYNARLSQNFETPSDRSRKPTSQPPPKTSSGRYRPVDVGSRSGRSMPVHGQPCNGALDSFLSYTGVDKNRKSQAAQDNRYIGTPQISYHRTDLERDNKPRENPGYSQNPSRLPAPPETVHRNRGESSGYKPMYNDMPIVQSIRVSNEPPSERESSSHIPYDPHILSGLMSEVDVEMARAELYNLPFKRDPCRSDGTPNSSKLNPQATEFRPNVSQNLQSDLSSHEQSQLHNAHRSRNRYPSIDTISLPDQNNNYVIQLGDSQGSKSAQEIRESYGQIPAAMPQRSWGDRQLQVSTPTVSHQASQVSTQGNEFGGFQHVAVYDPNLIQTPGNLMEPARVYLPTTTPGQILTPQTPHVDCHPTASYTQTPQIADYQQISVYNPPPACQNDFQTPSTPHYVQAALGQGFPQPGVMPPTPYPDQNQFINPENFQTPEQSGTHQELPPNAIVLSGSMTPVPVIATPITPLGLYNSGQFTYQVASLPAQPVVNRVEEPMRIVQTDPRPYTPTHQQTFFQHPPILNFQAYCMTVENDQPFQYPDSNIPRIEDITNKPDVNEKKASLMDRVGHTIKEVQESLKTSKTRRRDGQENWEEILEKLLKLPPNFHEPNDMAEYKQLRKLSEVISTYIKEVKKDSPSHLSDSEIFKEALDLSWPVASMDLGTVSGKVNPLPEIISHEDKETNCDISRAERISKSRLMLQKAWHELAMTISRKCSLQMKNSANLTQLQELTPEIIPRSDNPVISDDLPQCDQMHPSVSGPGQGSLVYVDNNNYNVPYPAPLTDHAGPQNDQCLPPHVTAPHSAALGPGGLDDDTANRRDSLGGVNVGTRISYFESNAKVDEEAQRQSKNKK